MIEIIESLNIAAVAGAMGGVVRYAVFRESYGELARNIVTGGITAHYTALTASVGLLNWLKISVLPPPLTHELYTGCVAFVIGFFGVVLLVYAQEKIIEKKLVPKVVRETPNE